MIPKNEKNKKKGPGKELIFSVFFAILFIGLVAVLIGANLKINTKRQEMVNRIDELRKEIKDLESKNKELDKEVNASGSPEALEKIAREQLGMKKPGEEVVVINTDSQKEEKKPEEAKPEEQKAGVFQSIWKWFTGK